MNYNRVTFLFIELYKELCETFDDFKLDFAKAIDEPTLQNNLVNISSESEGLLNYFEEITQSRKAVEIFIKERLAPAVKARQKFDVSSSYHYVVAKKMRVSNIEVGRNTDVNYAAFKRKLLKSFDMAQKDIHELIRMSD